MQRKSRKTFSLCYYRWIPSSPYLSLKSFAPSQSFVCLSLNLMRLENVRTVERLESTESLCLFNGSGQPTVGSRCGETGTRTGISSRACGLRAESSIERFSHFHYSNSLLIAKAIKVYAFYFGFQVQLLHAPRCSRHPFRSLAKWQLVIKHTTDNYGQ